MLERVIAELPPDLQDEVIDFARFLLQTKAKQVNTQQHRKQQHKLRLGWAGGLSEFRDQFTALELQKKALEWWG